MKKIIAFINSPNFLLRIAVLNIVLLVLLIVYGTVSQFSEYVNESTVSTLSYLVLRVFAGLVLVALSTLPFITGWYFNTKLDKKIALRIFGLIIFFFMSYQFLHPLFTKNQLTFEIGYIIIPIIINVIMVLLGSSIYVSEYIKKNRDSNIAS